MVHSGRRMCAHGRDHALPLWLPCGLPSIGLQPNVKTNLSLQLSVFKIIVVGCVDLIS